MVLRLEGAHKAVAEKLHKRCERHGAGGSSRIQKKPWKGLCIVAKQHILMLELAEMQRDRDINKISFLCAAPES